MPSPYVVLKFGGTSVSSRAHWDTIAATLRARLEEGLRPLAVCSALSDVTDQLEALVRAAAEGAHEEPLAALRTRHTEMAGALGLDAATVLSERFEELEKLTRSLALTGQAAPALHARIVAFGELFSTALGTAFLEEQGLRTQWLHATTLLRATDQPKRSIAARYHSATCSFDVDEALQTYLSQRNADVLLTQGFIAGNGAGDPVLLGRGGSDTSAAYLAAKLQARRLEIWTDVPGLFSADPRAIPSARLLRRLSYNEAQELATMGAKVLHPRCIAPVRAHGIPLHVRSTPHPDLDGTVISGATDDAQARVKAVSAKTGVALISMRTLGMWQQVGFLADVFAVFQRHSFSVDLVATSETEVTVSLDATENALESGALERLVEDLGAHCEAQVLGPCAVVSLVGRRIRAILHRLGPALEVFEEQQVHLLSQAASDLNFSFVVDEAQAARTARALHAQLIDPQSAGAFFGPTWQELFEDAPARRERPWWHRRRADLLALAEEASPVYVYDEATLHQRAATVRTLGTVDRAFYAMKANPNPDVLRLFAEAGLGFECVSPGEVQRVREVLPDLDPNRILFTPNFAPRAEYAFGLGEGLHVTLDNLHPLEQWPGVFEGHDLILRVDPGQGRGHHRHVRTAGPQSKFGIGTERLGRARALAKAAGARVVGLHAHLGSGIVAAETWAETAALLAALAEDFPDVRLLNVGGGLGVAERPGGAGLDLETVDESLRAFKTAHPQFELWMEPGRFLVAEAGVLLARVTQLKEKTGDVQYVGLETGTNSLIRPALYGAYHEIANLTRLGAPPAMTAEVVGPICESGDVLGHSRRLPATEEGDVLLIATAGAYGHAMRSAYNLRPPATERLLRAAGVALGEPAQ